MQNSEPVAQAPPERSEKSRIKIIPTYFRGSQLPDDLFLITMNAKKHKMTQYLIQQEIAQLEYSIKQSEKQLSLLLREEAEPRRIGRPPGSLNKKTIKEEEIRLAMEEAARNAQLSEVSSHIEESSLRESSIITAVTQVKEAEQLSKVQNLMAVIPSKKKTGYRKMMNNIKRFLKEREEMDSDKKMRLMVNKHRDTIIIIKNESKTCPKAARALRKLERLLKCKASQIYEILQEPRPDEEKLAQRKKYKKFEKLCPCCKKNVRRHLCEHTHCSSDCIMKKRQDDRKKKYNDLRYKKRLDSSTLSFKDAQASETKDQSTFEGESGVEALESLPNLTMAKADSVVKSAKKGRKPKIRIVEDDQAVITVPKVAKKRGRKPKKLLSSNSENKLEGEAADNTVEVGEEKDENKDNAENSEDQEGEKNDSEVKPKKRGRKPGKVYDKLPGKKVRKKKRGRKPKIANRGPGRPRKLKKVGRKPKPKPPVDVQDTSEQNLDEEDLDKNDDDNNNAEKEDKEDDELIENMKKPRKKLKKNSEALPKENTEEEPMDENMRADADNLNDNGDGVNVEVSIQNEPNECSMNSVRVQVLLELEQPQTTIDELNMEFENEDNNEKKNCEEKEGQAFII